MAKKKIQTIPFESIVLDKSFNARVDYDDDALKSLKESIMSSGLLQPIGVTTSGHEGPTGEKQYFVVYGFRRYLAMTMAREELGKDAFASIDVVVNEGTLEELRERNLKENIDRQSLKPHEIGAAIKKMVNSGLEQRDIGTRLGRPQSWVSYHYKAETKLGPVAREAYVKGDITLEQALNIADVPEEAQADVVNEVLNAGTRTEARKIAKKASQEAGTRRTYVNKGRPTAKNLMEHVSDASFKAAESEKVDEDKAFYNGLAAGIRVALGDYTLEELTPAEDYTDIDYNKASVKETEEPVKPKKKAKKEPKKKVAKATSKVAKRPPGRPKKQKAEDSEDFAEAV